MKVLVVCSKYFYKNIPQIEATLIEQGHIVSMPNSYDDPMAEEKLKSLSVEEHRKWKGMMLRRDKENIEPVDAVLVLNLEKNGKPNYIGGATFLEVAKAFELEKKIFFYNPIPECIFTDELVGMSPIIINSHLELIK